MQQQERETYYRQWIENCITSGKEGESKAALLQHIQKHAGPDLMRRVMEGEEADWAGWIASMYNLLAIFELRFINRQVTVAEKIDKMHQAWLKHQDDLEGPPENT